MLAFTAGDFDVVHRDAGETEVVSVLCRTRSRPSHASMHRLQHDVARVLGISVRNIKVPLRKAPDDRRWTLLSFELNEHVSASTADHKVTLLLAVIAPELTKERKQRRPSKRGDRPTNMTSLARSRKAVGGLVAA